MTRQIETPEDFRNYPENVLVFRDNRGHDGRVVEAQWEDGEIVSLAENPDGGWDKAGALRLGAGATKPDSDPDA